MLNEIYTLDDVEVKGKTALVRVDLNSSVGEDGKIQKSARFAAHGRTIKELSQKGGKIVAIAHQGRPGDHEFRSLREHAELLSQETGIEVKFIQDIFGPAAIEKIKTLQSGDVLLLENLRLLSEENLERDARAASTSLHVQKLASVVDLFVNDAFSVSHRSQASMVGFNALLPSVAGRVMEKELAALHRLSELKTGAVFLLGGVKAKEVIDIIKAVCSTESGSKILLCGAVSLLFLKAKGLSLGEPTEESLRELKLAEFLPVCCELLKKHPGAIVTPLDVAVDLDGRRKEYSTVDFPLNYPILDIGAKTTANYVQFVKSADVVFAKGAAGEFEKKEFSHATRQLASELTETKAFTVLGGGSLSTAFDYFKLDKSKISHVSLSGGALLEALSGKKLPGVEALKQSQSS